MAAKISVPFDDVTDPGFLEFLSRCPFRWQGDIGVQNWLFELYQMGAPAAPAAAPVLTSIAPDTEVAGAADTVITLTGTDFVTGAVVVEGANDLATTFTSATELSATIPATALAAAATLQVSVRNPDGQLSAQVPFTVT